MCISLHFEIKKTVRAVFFKSFSICIYILITNIGTLKYFSQNWVLSRIFRKIV